MPTLKLKRLFIRAIVTRPLLTDLDQYITHSVDYNTTVRILASSLEENGLATLWTRINQFEQGEKEIVSSI